MRFLLFTIPTILLACGQADQGILMQELMDRRVHERLTTFIESEKSKCKSSLLKEASQVADSILRANPILIQIDSLMKPPKPLKPPNPNFIRPDDTIKIAPVLPKRTEIN